MLVEVVAAVLSGSLALLADAGHMLTDGAAIGPCPGGDALRNPGPPRPERTFGYRRLEVLAALLNALTLWVIAAGVIFEAYRRFGSPPEVEGELMLGVGAVGLLVNVAAAWILHGSAKHSVNVEGAFQHVVADLLGSLAVVLSGVLILAFGWYVADPIVSALIGVLILLSTWRLLKKVVHVLLEGTPPHVDVRQMCSKIEALAGVVLVHDVHVWTIAPGYDALSAHVVADPDDQGEMDALLRRVRRVASEDFGIRHVTVQMERSADGCTEDHHVDRLTARKPRLGVVVPWGLARGGRGAGGGRAALCVAPRASPPGADRGTASCTSPCPFWWLGRSFPRHGPSAPCCRWRLWRWAWLRSPLVEWVLQRHAAHRYAYADDAAIVASLSGIALHALLEGAAFAGDPIAAPDRTAFAVAVALHRVLLGLVIWWLVRPRHGPILAALAVAAVPVVTVAGYLVGGELGMAGEGPGVALYQAFVAGTLLHVVFHQGRRDHDHAR